MKTIYTFLFCCVSILCYAQIGTVSTILNDPNADVDDALALDSRGNLYGSNFAGETVYKISARTGEVTPFVTGLSNPNGLAFDRNNNLFVVEYSGGVINKYDRDGNLLATFPVGGFPSGLIKEARSNNMIFTQADFGAPESNGVFQLMSDGTVNTIHQGAPLQLPVGLTYDRMGNLYVGDYLTREIYRIPRNGGLEYVATVPAPNNFVPFLAFIAYAKGSIYGTIYGENKIYIINPDNIDDVEEFSGSVFGDMDGDISEATYAFPAGILASRSGNTLYVSEFSGVGNIRKIVLGPGPGNREHTEDTSMAVYPNPTSEFVNIQIENKLSKEYAIRIYNLFGKLTYESQKTSEAKKIEETISVANWKPGIYTIAISFDDKIQHKKLIVTK